MCHFMAFSGWSMNLRNSHDAACWAGLDVFMMKNAPPDG